MIERVFKKGLSGKVAFECGLKGVMSLHWWSIPDRGNSKCKGPWVRDDMACSKKRHQ